MPPEFITLDLGLVTPWLSVTSTFPSHKILVPQNPKTWDSKALHKEYINLLLEWQEFYKNIINTAIIIKNSGLLDTVNRISKKQIKPRPNKL